MHEFNRMRGTKGWSKRKSQAMLNKALVNQFNLLYGTDEESIESWQILCRVLNIHPIPKSLNGCRRVSCITGRSARVHHAICLHRPWSRLISISLIWSTAGSEMTTTEYEPFQRRQNCKVIQWIQDIYFRPRVRMLVVYWNISFSTMLRRKSLQPSRYLGRHTTIPSQRVLWIARTWRIYGWEVMIPDMLIGKDDVGIFLQRMYIMIMQYCWIGWCERYPLRYLSTAFKLTKVMGETSNRIIHRFTSNDPWEVSRRSCVNCSSMP